MPDFISAFMLLFFNIILPVKHPVVFPPVIPFPNPIAATGPSGNVVLPTIVPDPFVTVPPPDISGPTGPMEPTGILVPSGPTGPTGEIPQLPLPIGITGPTGPTGVLPEPFGVPAYNNRSEKIMPPPLPPQAIDHSPALDLLGE